MTFEIQWLKVKKTSDHIDVLYQILKVRKHFISNKRIPNYKEHSEFVKNHPYRHWFLLKKNKKFIGSIYITSLNTIGLDTYSIKENMIESIFLRLFSKIKPLPEIKSIRPKSFSINISPSNRKLAVIIKNIGGKKIQSTYEFNL